MVVITIVRFFVMCTNFANVNGGPAFSQDFPIWSRWFRRRPVVRDVVRLVKAKAFIGVSAHDGRNALMLATLEGGALAMRKIRLVKVRLIHSCG